MLVCIPGKVATVATVVTLRKFRRRAFFTRIMLNEFSIIDVQIPHFSAPSVSSFIYRFVVFPYRPPGP